VPSPGLARAHTGSDQHQWSAARRSGIFPDFRADQQPLQPSGVDEAPNIPDYPVEAKSEYEGWVVLGWPHESSVAMARLGNVRPLTKVTLRHTPLRLDNSASARPRRTDVGWAWIARKRREEQWRSGPAWRSGQSAPSITSGTSFTVAGVNDIRRAIDENCARWGLGGGAATVPSVIRRVSVLGFAVVVCAKLSYSVAPIRKTAKLPIRNG
jgi:hypothetical protein